MNSATAGYVKGGNHLPEIKKGLPEKIVDGLTVVALVIGVSGAICKLTLSEKEFSDLQSRLGKPIITLVQRIDLSHRESMNEVYGDGYFPFKETGIEIKK